MIIACLIMLVLTHSFLVEELESFSGRSLSPELYHLLIGIFMFFAFVTILTLHNSVIINELQVKVRFINSNTEAYSITKK